MRIMEQAEPTELTHLPLRDAVASREDGIRERQQGAWAGSPECRRGSAT
jgi:hypothetical protein